ncbi:MAG TPA: 1-acyl-sn-glycerol-3-phosphate acyltransferase [Myxococcaceae bacterium]|nr:1-acyl-sn-glycerol-3-phosphate acyltransferase [Myxococcaceae bacterium]
MATKIPREKCTTARESSDFASGWTDRGVGQFFLSILLWAWVGLSCALLSLIGLILFVPFNPWTDPRREMMEFISRLWGKGIAYVLRGIAIRVTGRENLSACPGPFVICSNHQSVADIPLLLAVLPPFKFIAKPALFWLPPLGLQLRISGYIPAAGGEPGGAERVLSQAQSWLRRGVHILVFPEGTRSRDGRILRFRQGAFALAQRAGVPVLPVAITGTRRVIPKGSFAFRFVGKVHVEILRPVGVDEDPKAVASRVRGLLQEAVSRSEHDSGCAPR